MAFPDIVVRENGTGFDIVVSDPPAEANYDEALDETVSLVEAVGLAFDGTLPLVETVDLDEDVVGLKPTHEEVLLEETVVPFAESVSMGQDQYLAETVSLSETVVAGLVGDPVDLAETVTFSEARTSFSAAQKPLLEPVALSEAVVADRTFQIALPESVFYDESMFGGFGFEALLTETVTVAEGVVGPIARRVALAESTTLEVSVTGTVIAPGTIQVALEETLAFSEALVTKKATAAAVSESVAFVESTAGGGDNALPLEEEVDFIEAGIARQRWADPLDETVPDWDELLEGGGQPRATLAESLSLAELNLLHASFKRPLSETVTAAELLADRAVSEAALGESVTLAEAVVRVPALTISPLSEVVSVSEARASLFDALAPVAETVTFTEAVGAIRTIDVLLGESVSVDMSIETAGSYVAGLSGLRESYNHIREAQRTKAVMASAVAEASISVSDAVGHRLAVRLRWPELLPWSDTVGILVRTARAVAETVPYAEAGLGRFHALPPVLDEEVALGEALETLARYRSAHGEEYMTFRERVNKHRKAGLPVLTETVSFSEAGEGRRRVSENLIEDPIALSESLQARYRSGVHHRESYSLFERTWPGL